MSNDKLSHTQDQEIKRLIEQTKAVLHKQSEDQNIKIRKPQTAQGWVLVIGGIASTVAFFVSSIVYLNEISNHSSSGSHKETVDLLAKVNDKIDKHSDDKTVHFTENDLKVIMAEQNSIIVKDVNQLKQDTKVIQRSLDFLVNKAVENSD